MASVPFEFTLAGVEVRGNIKKIGVADRLTLRNDFSALFFKGESIGTEPNVARAINRVLSFALGDGDPGHIYVGGHKTKIDPGTPLKNVEVEGNDEFNDYVTDDLLKEVVKVNTFLGRDGSEERPNPFAQLFRQYAPDEAETPDPTASNGRTAGSAAVTRPGSATNSSIEES